MTEATNPTPEAEAVARLQSIKSMLGRISGPTASVRIYEHEAKVLLAALSTLPQTQGCGEQQCDGKRHVVSDMTGTYFEPCPKLSAPAQPDAGEGLTPADAKWLATFLQGQKEEGHCGEGTFERRERAAWNSRLDRISAALMSETEG